MLMPASAESSDVRDSFLATVISADLLGPNQLARARTLIPSNVKSIHEAATSLVAAGLLTRFQADHLLSGSSDGLHLGAYTVLEELGSSRTCRVYRAKHRTMNRTVAIKVLSPERINTTLARDAFQRDTRAAAQLNHPNIVTTYDAYEDSGRFYIVMELVEGPNLLKVVSDRGPLKVQEVCQFAWQVAAGLDHAHEKGLIHGKIFPAKLLLSRPTKSAPDVFLKIAGFGVPRLHSLQMMTLGHEDNAPQPRYCDRRIDLFGLGGVMYYLLTGISLFQSEHFAPLCLRKSKESYPRIEHFRPDVPPPLAALIHQLLSQHSDAKPTAAIEVIERLDELTTPSCAVNFDLYEPVPDAKSCNSSPNSESETASAYTRRDVGGNSPWEEITTPTAGDLEVTQVTPSCLDNAQPHALRTHQARRGRGSWLFAAVAMLMLAICVGAIRAVVLSMTQ
jgi:serine/threonine protein kinase